MFENGTRFHLLIESQMRHTGFEVEIMGHLYMQQSAVPTAAHMLTKQTHYALRLCSPTRPICIIVRFRALLIRVCLTLLFYKILCTDNKSRIRASDNQDVSKLLNTNQPRFPVFQVINHVELIVETIIRMYLQVTLLFHVSN